MTEIVPAPPRAPPPPPAWGRAAVWSTWIGTSYAGVLVLGRLLVVYRFGGEALSAYFAVLLGSTVLTALLLWPLLAHAARRPVVAEVIRSILQWSAVLGFGLSFVIG